MKKEKVNHSSFIKQVSKETGYAQKDIKTVLEAVADITVQNLNEDKSTTIVPGIVVYPSIYNNEFKFPRARFGVNFKLDAPIL